jgi:hypothetical protein
MIASRDPEYSDLRFGLAAVVAVFANQHYIIW